MTQQPNSDPSRLTVGQALLIGGILLVGGLSIQQGHTLFGLVIVMGLAAGGLNLLFRLILRWAMRHDNERENTHDR